MLRFVFMVSCVLLHAACAPSPEQHDSAERNAAPLSAAGTYQRHCAGCHDSGSNGAPVLGVEADWADRSGLWQAVVFDHATEGYLQMPAKGGDPTLTDAAVEAAAEYMLERTFTDRPAD